MYSVELSTRSQKFINKLDNHIKIRIKEKLIKLSENQVPSDSKFICRDKGDKIFRMRIGDYRALYKVKAKETIVLITKIDKRTRVYQ